MKMSDVLTRSTPALPVKAGSIPPGAKSISNLSNVQPRVPSSTVSISGGALMRQRLFYSQDPNYKLPSVVKPGVNTSMLPPENFLTRDDRKLLPHVYGFAQAQGVDLLYVDELARSLADYRYHDEGRRLNPHNRGDAFDLEGHIVSYSFSDKDTETAKRILNSEAIKTTQLDHGFLRHTLNKDHGSLSHSNFDFLEQIVTKFSDKGADVPPLDAKFGKYESIRDNYVKYLSKETYNTRGDGKGEGSIKKNKTTKPQPAAAPETLKDILRRILAKAMRMNGTGVPSLAEFLVKFRR